jgi:diguanylate cyclase (GGDEF)-like protein
MLLVALMATQLPLLTVALAAWRSDLSEASIVALLLLATTGGTIVLLAQLRARLRPVEVASRRLRRYLHLGVLDVGGPYSDDELGRLLAEVDEVCLRLDDARLQAEHAAAVDHLTGALTRRAAEAKLLEVARRARRRDDHLSIALVDLDHFKAVNDQLGHAAGDAALRHTVLVLQRSLRGVGLVGRWGGDELLVVVRGRADEAAAGLDRAREAVAARLRQVLGRPVTISVGVAELRRHDTVAGCLAMADGALYLAKAQGRDQVVNAVADVLALPG